MVAIGHSSYTVCEISDSNSCAISSAFAESK